MFICAKTSKINLIGLTIKIGVQKWKNGVIRDWGGWMDEFSSKAENFDCLNVQICKEEEEENYMKNWLDEFIREDWE